MAKNNNAAADHDSGLMRAALGLARRGLGDVWPNPAVGCIVVDRAGAVAGRGWTQPGGRPHAETEALRRAGPAARGGTAYVTLEPCSHHGKTPPCAEALIAAGIARVVVAAPDPDPRVDGRGIAMLRAAGLEVVEGVLRAEAEELNRGFLSRIGRGRPWTALKLATSLDGKIALGNGTSQWITGEAARAYGHLLRAQYDAIVVGSGTALADDPELSCRLPGLGRRSPVRVVLDGRLRTPLDGKLVMGAPARPTWIVTGEEKSTENLRPFLDNGVEVVTVPGDRVGRPDPLRALEALAGRGVTRVLIEGGAAVAASFLACGLIDEVFWFRSPGIIGEDGRGGVADLGLSALADGPVFERREVRALGNDMLERLERAQGLTTTRR